MICCGCDADLSCAVCGCEMPEDMGIEALDVATKWKSRHDELLKALKQIQDAAHKASAVPAERLQDIRVILGRVGGEKL